MSRDWEAQFRDWAKPPGKTEEDRCENAISAVRNAIKASQKLQSRDVSILLQGSYQNNTNVRQDSDVDIGVVCSNTFFYELPQGTTTETFNISPASYPFAQFKREVEEALVEYFGGTAVKRGNKAFDIHETSYHVEADVVPFFEHRRYLANGRHLTGVELQPDNSSGRIINWPEQHYDNGCAKNNDTGKRFKAIVRALKRLSIEMAEANNKAGDIPGFLIECLVWNVPNDAFQNDSYIADLKASLLFLYNHTKSDEPCKEWGEVSELKYLFRPQQKWSRQQVNAFTVAAWHYAGFGE